MRSLDGESLDELANRMRRHFDAALGVDRKRSWCNLVVGDGLLDERLGNRSVRAVNEHPTDDHSTKDGA